MPSSYHDCVIGFIFSGFLPFWFRVDDYIFSDYGQLSLNMLDKDHIHGFYQVAHSHAISKILIIVFTFEVATRY